MFKQIVLLASKAKTLPYSLPIQKYDTSVAQQSSCIIENKNQPYHCDHSLAPTKSSQQESRMDMTEDRDDLLKTLDSLCTTDSIDDDDEDSNLKGPDKEYLFAVNRLLELTKALKERTRAIKSKITEPLSDYVEKEDTVLSFDIDWSRQNDEQTKYSCWDDFKSRVQKRQLGVFDPQGYLYLSWLLLITLAFLYNAWTIFLASTFPVVTSNNMIYFLAVDYFCDTLYLFDVIIFKSRLQFVKDGEVVKSPQKTRLNYINNGTFKLDCASLIPLDLFYVKNRSRSILRLTRVLKIKTFWEFFDLVDANTRRPYVVRIIRTLIYMMFMIHLNACAYYFISSIEGFNSNEWVYDGHGNAYLICFYFAIRTATSISGKMPKPTNVYEYVFMSVSWLLGIFVFAFLIGQIRDIVATANQNQAQYRHLMDSLINYMKNLNLSEDIQTRVRDWLNHAWDQKRIFYESKIFSYLPHKIRTDIALDVHYDILSKVDLFKRCESNLIKDVVSKLRPVLFLPGDFVCRKGEMAHEMYIVNDGKLQVLDGDNSDNVITYLEEGSVFGEISILGIPGYFRRTADVKSIGFSNLFALHKTDLWETLRNYPQSQKMLHRKVKQLIKEKNITDKTLPFDETLPEVKSKINTRPGTPKLFKTAMKLINRQRKDKIAADESLNEIEPTESVFKDTANRYSK